MLVAWGGINDIDPDDGNVDRETVYARLETYCQNRKAAGWTVVVNTLLPAPDSKGGLDYETNRQWINNKIRTELLGTYADAVADVGGANTILGDAGDNLNETYFISDHVHLNTAGYTVVKDAVLAALNSLGFTVTGTTMAFTEFCCKSGGSNLNAGTRNGGSTEPGTSADFTYASGSWVQSTGVFTVASGNPVTDGVAVGDFASVYPDAASVTPFVGKVTARDATTITVSLTAKAGTAPVDGTSDTTLKIGGAWAGPNGAEDFPFGFVQNTLASADALRINFKNAAQYDITAGITQGNAGPITWEGYTTTYGDGGVAIIDGGTSGVSYILLSGTGANNAYRNLTFQNNGASGAAVGVSAGGSESVYFNINVNSVRGTGLLLASNTVTVIGGVSHTCNQSNTANHGGLNANVLNYHVFNRICRDNAGSNSCGFLANNSAGGGLMSHCIAHGNGKDGFALPNGTGTHNILEHCDSYDNGGSGLLVGNSSAGLLIVRNSNFVKNAAFGIDFDFGSTVNMGYILNCGFGAGTMANVSGAIGGLGSVVEEGSITYADDVTPWTDPDNGDFSINLAAKGAGYGVFDGTTVGHPDIGAAQHEDAGGVAAGIAHGGSGPAYVSYP